MSQDDNLYDESGGPSRQRRHRTRIVYSERFDIIDPLEILDQLEEAQKGHT